MDPLLPQELALAAASGQAQVDGPSAPEDAPLMSDTAAVDALAQPLPQADGVPPNNQDHVIERRSFARHDPSHPMPVTVVTTSNQQGQ